MTPKYWLPQLERETIEESVYLSKLDTTVKLLVAKKEDEEVLLRYIAEQFSQDEPIDSASGIKPDELAKRYKSTLERSLNDSFTIVAVDCFEVCGLVTANRVQKGPNRVGEMKDGYKEEILASNASCLAAKQIEVFVNEFESFSPNYLPDECKEFYRIDLFSVLPEYRGSGLGKMLWQESLKLAHQQKFRFVESGCSAKASTFIGTKLGMRIAYSIPYVNFKVDEKPVFGDVLKDGSTEANMLIGDLNEIAKSFENNNEKFQLPSAYKISPNKDRQLIEEFYVAKLGRSLRLEVATNEDGPIVKQFIYQEFYKQGPMLRTLQGDKQSHRELCSMVGKDFDEKSLNKGLTFIVTDNQHLCALVFNWPKKIKHDQTALKNEELKEDFTKKINSSEGGSLEVRKLGAILEWLQGEVPKYIPDEYSEIFYIDSLSVHPKYRGLQLGQKLWDHSLKEAYLRGYKYAQAICTALGSTKIALNSGMTKAFAYPLELFKYEGKPIFPLGRLYEGCCEASIVIGNLEQILGSESETK